MTVHTALQILQMSNEQQAVALRLNFTVILTQQFHHITALAVHMQPACTCTSHPTSSIPVRHSDVSSQTLANAFAEKLKPSLSM